MKRSAAAAAATFSSRGLRPRDVCDPTASNGLDEARRWLVPVKNLPPVVCETLLQRARLDRDRDRLRRGLAAAPASTGCATPPAVVPTATV